MSLRWSSHGRLLATLVMVLASITLDAQEFRVTAFQFDATGRAQVSLGGDPTAYYRLERGDTLTNIESVAVLAAGGSGTLMLTDPVPLTGRGAQFYRIRQVPRSAPLDSDADGMDDVFELDSVLRLDPLDPLDAEQDPDGDGKSNLEEYQAGTDPFVANLTALTTVTSSPAAFESGVSVNRETVIQFSRPLAAEALITSERFFAGVSGRRLLTRIELSSDRRKASLFYLEPLPGSTRVNVVLDTTGLRDDLGRGVDADDNGLAGGMKVFSFDTFSHQAIGTTAVTGQVFASDPEPDPQNLGKFLNRPLPGVIITVDGAEETLRVTTDVNGRFTLQPAPAGRFFVHIDGRRAPDSSWPEGNYYPFVGKAWESVAGRTDNLAGGTGEIFLPLVVAGTLKPVGATQDTEIRFPASVVAQNPALDGVSITVPANALFADTGLRGGRVGIAPVSPDRLPSPLPAGLELPLVITIQTDGPQNFDRPVPVRFPNLPLARTGQPLAPGTKSALWSFNHDTGEWEVVGPMTVTEDGKFVVTDPGVGVLQPGWHGSLPGVPASGGGGFGGCGSGPAAGGGPGSGGPSGGGGGDDGSGPVPAGIGVLTARGIQRHDVGGGPCRPKPGFDPASTVNGCGPAGLGPTAKALLKVLTQVQNSDNPYGDECTSFFDACAQHDIGYSTCGKPKNEVDAQFLRDMLAKCGCLTDPDERADCRLYAVTYFNLVSDYGDGAYEAGQDEGCDCDPPPNPQCEDEDPPGPEPALAAFGRVRRSDETAPRNGSLRPRGPVVRQHGAMHFLLLNQQTGQIVQRGSLGDAGAGFERLILAPNTPYEVVLLQDSNLEEGWLQFTTGESGTRFEIPKIYLRKSTTYDLDGDGLHDLGELIVGSDLQNSDSDGDGIADGIEIQQGSDPLDGRPAAIGLMAQTDTPGEAQDVAAANDTVIVADGAAGVAVFSAPLGRLAHNPVLLRQIDLPGAALRVSWNGGMFAAVADDSAGLAILDMSQPANVTLARQVPLGDAALSVLSAGRLTFVGLRNQGVALVDMATGEVLQRLFTGAAVNDLQYGADVLYALLDHDLVALEFVGGILRELGRVGSPVVSTGNSRLNIGGGFAYAVHGQGVNVFDLTNPMHPRLVHAGSTAAFGWKQFVPNGSGLALSPVGTSFAFDTAHDVSAYDMSDPADPEKFVLEIPTPGISRALVIYDGLAYVASHQDGLQVINYLATDTLGVAPEITLEGSFQDGRIEEGQLTRLTAQVRDDVQVGLVEFFVDGERIVSDGSFPFEARFLAPSLSGSKTNLVARARAVDTGGNATLTPALTLTLVPDATPPRVLRTTPQDGGIQGGTDTLRVFFPEPLNEGTIATGAFQLVHLGADGAPGTQDDTVITGLEFTYDAALKAVFLHAPALLQPGEYQLRIGPPLTDLAGNAAIQTEIRFLIFDGTDLDQDGVPDAIEPLLGLDPTSADTNGNGIPDGREDFDQDGLNNAGEILLGADPRNPDSNSNGVKDGDEDTDGDGLSDGQELRLGTNPRNPDTDFDGWPDEGEITGGSDPRNPMSVPQLMFLGAPALELLVPAAVIPSGGVGGVTLARPMVEIISPRADIDARVSLGVTVARPPLELLVPAAVAPSGQVYGLTLAHPPFEIIAPSASTEIGAPLGITLARPPIEILAPWAFVRGDFPGEMTLAQPPLTIQFDSESVPARASP